MFCSQKIYISLFLSKEIKNVQAISTTKFVDLCYIVSDLRDPFSLQKGWLLWAGIGLFGAIIAIALTGAAMSLFSGETPEREVRN